MAENCQQRRQNHPADVSIGPAARDPNREVALGRVEQKCGDACVCACNAADVRGADIAAAGTAYVAAFGQLHD